MGTRDRILDAAAHVMHVRGLARATTKEIAKEAGYSEAALYKHFRDKTDLFLGVLNERVPSNLTAVLAKLDERAGTGRVVENLEELARTALLFYGEMFPIAASLFSEPALLVAHREALAERNSGPHTVLVAVASYLEAERVAGGIGGDVDPRAAASLLLGACFQHAFFSNFAGEAPDEDAADEVASSLVRTLVNGLTS